MRRSLARPARATHVKHRERQRISRPASTRSSRSARARARSNGGGPPISHRLTVPKYTDVRTSAATAESAAALNSPRFFASIKRGGRDCTDVSEDLGRRKAFKHCAAQIALALIHLGSSGKISLDQRPRRPIAVHARADRRELVATSLAPRSGEVSLVRKVVEHRLARDIRSLSDLIDRRVSEPLRSKQLKRRRHQPLTHPQALALPPARRSLTIIVRSRTNLSLKNSRQPQAPRDHDLDVPRREQSKRAQPTTTCVRKDLLECGRGTWNRHLCGPRHGR